MLEIRLVLSWLLILQNKRSVHIWQCTERYCKIKTFSLIFQSRWRWPNSLRRALNSDFKQCTTNISKYRMWHFYNFLSQAGYKGLSEPHISEHMTLRVKVTNLSEKICIIYLIYKTKRTNKTHSSSVRYLPNFWPSQAVEGCWRT